MSVALFKALLAYKSSERSKLAKESLWNTSKTKTKGLRNPQKRQRCRVCLRSDPDISYIAIFASGGVIAEEIRKFGDVEISEDDGMPGVMCQGCLNLLNAAVLFRNKAQAADRCLKSSGDLDIEHTEDITNWEVPNVESNAKPAEGDIHELDIDWAARDDSDDEDIILFDNELPQRQDSIGHKYRHKCRTCSVKFSNYKQSREHFLSAAHRKKVIQCPQCGLSLYAVNLKAHLHTHTTGRPHVCHICGKDFHSKPYFKRHLKLHTDVVPYKCPECPYRGRFRDSLKLHMRVHTGERPYVCEQCPGRFINASNLRRHQLTHQGPQMRCEPCGRAFYTKALLREHLRVDHTGLKEHKCDMCDHAFGHRSLLMLHTRKVHKRPKLRTGRVPVYLQVERRMKELQASLKRESSAEPDGE